MLSKSSWNPAKIGPESSRRRSQRVIISLPVAVRAGESTENGSFQEQTNTLVVNAHGALIALAQKVENGQNLRLTNCSSREEQPCRVVYVGQAAGDKTQIGVEFQNPSPEFWHIVFPPEDWAAVQLGPASAKDSKS